MRIAIIASFAPSLVKFRGVLLRDLVGRGHEVYAFAPENNAQVKNILRDCGVGFHTYPLSRQGTHPLRDLQTLRSLEQRFRDLKPHAVLAYTIKPVIWGTLAAARARVPRRVALITGMGAAFTPPFSARKRLVRGVVEMLYRLALPLAHAVVVQNPDDEAIVRRWVSSRKIHRIPGSGVDLEEFRPTPYPDTLTFLMLSRLIVDKGVREYVEAARIVKARHPEVRFRLAGWFEPDYPGSISREELDAWVREGVVEYLGLLDDVRPALAKCSVYVLPSYREGTPRSVLEAMAMARPVITTDAPGCRETVEHGKSGFLVPVRDARALAEAMERFLQNPDLISQMGREARRRAEEVFDVRKVNEILIGLLEGEEA